MPASEPLYCAHGQPMCLQLTNYVFQTAFILDLFLAWFQSSHTEITAAIFAWVEYHSSPRFLPPASYNLSAIQFLLMPLAFSTFPVCFRVHISCEEDYKSHINDTLQFSSAEKRAHNTFQVLAKLHGKQQHKTFGDTTSVDVNMLLLKIYSGREKQDPLQVKREVRAKKRRRLLSCCTGPVTPKTIRLRGCMVSWREGAKELTGATAVRTTCSAVAEYGRPRIRTITWLPVPLCRDRNCCASELFPSEKNAQWCTSRMTWQKKWLKKRNESRGTAMKLGHLLALDVLQQFQRPHSNRSGQKNKHTQCIWTSFLPPATLTKSLPVALYTSMYLWPKWCLCFLSAISLCSLLSKRIKASPFLLPCWLRHNATPPLRQVQHAVVSYTRCMCWTILREWSLGSSWWTRPATTTCRRGPQLEPRGGLSLTLYIAHSYPQVLAAPYAHIQNAIYTHLLCDKLVYAKQ